MPALAEHLRTLDRVQPLRLTGRVASLRGMTLLVRDLPAPVGSLVELAGERVNSAGGLGEVVGFDGEHAIVMTLSAPTGTRSGDPVIALQADRTVPVGFAMLGRVLDGLARPIDSHGSVLGTVPRPLDPEPIRPLARARIEHPLRTGVRSIDLFATLGRGQRMGVFAGPGVGKSTLLGAVARGAAADVSVVALIGERGREVRDFIERNLGEQGLARSVVVVATGDESPLLRVRAAQTACTIAEFFRDSGRSVMLIMDSVTRFAHAQRQIGLSVGEPPATRGYTPSVFAALARLLERAGTLSAGADGADGVEGRHAAGSITGLYSILVEGDEMTEPVSDAVRGILDGHLILSRSLAQRAHYPAIDILDSVSRVADDVTDAAHQAARRQLVRLLAAYKQVEDLVQIGAYARGSSPESDTAIRYHPQITDLLQQNLAEPLSGGSADAAFDAWRSRLVKLAIEAGAAMQSAPTQSAAGVARRN